MRIKHNIPQTLEETKRKDSSGPSNSPEQKGFPVKAIPTRGKPTNQKMTSHVRKFTVIRGRPKL